MPVKTINEGNDRWWTEDFTGGVNMYLHPTKIPDSQFTVFENLLVKSEGSYITADKREGFERYNTTQVHTGIVRSIGEYITQNKTSNVQRLICNAGGKLKYTDVTGGEYTGAWSAISNDTDCKTKYLTFKDNMYVCNRNNGADVNKFYDGTNFLDMGCLPCDNTVVTINDVAGGGSVEAGKYFYLVTFLYDGDQESAPLVYPWTYGVGIFIDVAAVGHVDLANIPTGNTRVTARKIYRSKKGSIANETAFYFAGIINDNTTTTFTDKKADSELGQLSIPHVDLFAIKNPYRSVYQASHQNRMIQANLQENVYRAIPSGDIAIADSGTAGSLPVAAGTYYFRFYKSWITQFTSNFAISESNLNLLHSPYVEISHVKADGITSLDITYSGSDPWFTLIAFEVKHPGGSYGFPLISFEYGYYKSLFAPFNFGNTGVSGNFFETIKADGKSKFQSSVFISNANEPDIFPAGNIMDIGDDLDELKGIFSRYGGIDVFKDTSINRIFTSSGDVANWEARKIVNGIGAGWAESIVQLPDDSYIFAMKKRTSGVDRAVFYWWDGSSTPKPISNNIQGYLNGIQITDIDAAHDRDNNFIRICYSISGSYKGEELIYDPNRITIAESGAVNTYEDWGNGVWYHNHRNTTDLELRCPFTTKAGKLLYGHEQGYIYHQSTGNQDKLGSGHANTQINVRIQPRTQEISDANLQIKHLYANIVTSGAGAANGLVIYTGIDDTESAMASPPTLASGENRIKVGTNYRAKKFYLRYENAENINIKFRMIGWDFRARHEGSGGRR